MMRKQLVKKQSVASGAIAAAGLSIIGAVAAAGQPGPIGQPGGLPGPLGEPEPPAEAMPREEEVPQEKAIPEPYGIYRYTPIWDNSPFMLETPVIDVVADSAFKDLAVTSVSLVDGRARVGLVNTKTRTTQSATNDKPNENGIQVVKVEPNRDPSKVVVELAMNQEKGTVTFDSVILQGKPTVPRPAAVAPGGAPTIEPPGGMVPPTPGGEAPATRRRIVLPKSVSKPNPGVPPQVAPRAAPPAPLQQPGPPGAQP